MAPKKSSKGKVSIPKYRWLMFWLLVLCSVALVCAIFGRVNVKTLIADGDTSAKDMQIRALEGELDNLQTSYSKAIEDVRVLSLTDRRPQHMTQLVSAYQMSGEGQGDCFSEAGPNAEDNFMNTTATSQLFKFQDKNTGVEMELPYSFEWGSECYRLDPVEVNAYATGSSIIGFGPASMYYNWGRNYTLRITDVTTNTQHLVTSMTTECKEMKGEWVNDCYFKQKPSVAGMPVYEFYSSGYESPENWAWYAIGKTHTYILGWSVDDKLTEAEAARVLQSLRATK